jgi:peptidoglycan/xylan/chitin deacetylase (PgdA/CDA1 family)
LEFKQSGNRFPVKIIVAAIAAVILVFGIFSIPIPVKAPSTTGAAAQGPCKCIIFRIDDIQDYWLNQVQTALMDHFISKDEKVTLGTIMHFVGNDSSIVSKIGAGYNSGTFELAIHGWDHVDYAKLSDQNQHDSLQLANQKMAALWGKGADIFIPPFNSYNNDTLSVLTSLNMKVISVAFSQELPNIYDPTKPNNPDNKVYKSQEGSDIKDNYGIYHIPEGVGFYDFEGATSSKTPIQTILGSIDNKISSYGYVVVTLHPQDFAIKDTNKKPVNQINPSEISDLDTIINYAHKQGYSIKSFTEALEEAAASQDK